MDQRLYIRKRVETATGTLIDPAMVELMASCVRFWMQRYPEECAKMYPTVHVRRDWTRVWVHVVGLTGS